MPPLPELPARLAMGRHQPKTFRERGVAVPFTTPLLQGGRIRPDSKAMPGMGGMELVIPNPGGGQGVYVLPWASLPDICVPTLHDLRLWQLLSQAPQVTPATLRGTVREVAIGGFAGREAALAARSANQAGPGARARVNHALLTGLVRETETEFEGAHPFAQDAPAAQETRMRRALGRVAHLLEWDSDGVERALRDMASLLQPLGIHDDPESSALPRQMRLLRDSTEEITGWAAAARAAREQGGAQVISSAAELTLRAAAALLAELNAAFAHPLDMLQRWRQDPAAFAELAARADWVMDGWPLICTLWVQAPEEDRLALCWDLALVVPLLPVEVEQWTGLSADWDAPARLRARMAPPIEGRGHRAATLVARVERALEAVV